MEFRQLRHFLAVADTLHFGKAADNLGMTQPPLSQSIIELERELSEPLFKRTNRKVELTSFGTQWLGYVRPALESVAALPETARRISAGRQGRLELSFVSTAAYTVLPALVRRFTTLYPDVDLVLNEATSDIQISSLVEGKGHAGIIIPPAQMQYRDDLNYRPLVLEPLVAAVPEAWLDGNRLRTQTGRLTAQALIDAPLIIFPRRSAPPFHDLIMGYYASVGGNPRIVQEAVQMQTIVSLVSAGIGIAFVPASMRHLVRTGAQYVELPHSAPVLETGIAWRYRDTTPTLARLIALMDEITMA